MTWAPSLRYSLYPLSAAGLWLAVIITPADAARCRTAKASRGVGPGCGSMCTVIPAPASTRAVSSANSADRCRASQPTTTLTASSAPRGTLPPGLPASPGPFPAAPPLAAESSSQPATAAVAALTTARFIRFGPAATTPRSPAVPNSSRPANRSRNSASACAANRPRRPGRLPQPRRPGRAAPATRPGPPRLGSSAIQASDRRPKLSLTHHLHHPSLTHYLRAAKIAEDPAVTEDRALGLPGSSAKAGSSVKISALRPEADRSAARAAPAAQGTAVGPERRTTDRSA